MYANSNVGNKCILVSLTVCGILFATCDQNVQMEVYGTEEENISDCDTHNT